MNFGNADRNIFAGDEGSQQRALMKCMGYTEDDLTRPIIGIANTYNTGCPGQINLRRVAEAVKEGIYRAGGTPVEFGAIGPCDGIADGNDGMRYILPSRDTLANSIECMVKSHQMDGVVMLGGCDKILPGVMLAAASMNLPAIVVDGGPMLPGDLNGQALTVDDVISNLGALQKGTMTREEYNEIYEAALPGDGSCAMMGTANTMCCFAEAIGLSLPGSAAIPAVYGARYQSAKEAGIRIVGMVKEGLKPRDIITKASLKNAIRTCMAFGGSTNIFLHAMALANAAGIDLNIREFNEMSDTTPTIAPVFPASKYTLLDFYKAGGVAAVMKELGDLLDTTQMTCTGKTVAENLSKIKNKNPDVIRPVDKAYSDNGGLAVVTGNICPDTGVTRPAVIAPECWKMTGPARVFDSELDLFEAISKFEIKDGDIIVVRYEGPKGGPGMRETYVPLELLKGMGMDRTTAIITDGRFSGCNSGCFVGHMCPEAADGGPIAILRDGDIIDIDIAARTVNVRLSDEEIAERFKTWVKPAPRAEEGYLAFYSQIVGPACEGAYVGVKSKPQNK